MDESNENDQNDAPDPEDQETENDQNDVNPEDPDEPIDDPEDPETPTEDTWAFVQEVPPPTYYESSPTYDAVPEQQIVVDTAATTAIEEDESDEDDLEPAPIVEINTDPIIEDTAERPEIDWTETHPDDPVVLHKEFDTTPVAPYSLGDIWHNNGSTFIAIRARTGLESFQESDWEEYIEEQIPPAPNPKTRTVTYREIIRDYSRESLLRYQQRGAIAFAIYDDGTEVQVPWSEVSEPMLPTAICVNEARELASATNQHFWSRVDNTDGAGAGAFITDDTQEAFLDAVQNNFPDFGDASDTIEAHDTFVGDGEAYEFSLSKTACSTTDSDYVVKVNGSIQTSGITRTATKLSFDNAPTNGSQIEVTYLYNKKPWHNILLNSLGMLLRQGLIYLASFTRSAVAFFDGEGNTDANIVATFGKNGSQIGLKSESHILLDYHSLQMLRKEGTTYFHVSDLRDKTGKAQIVNRFTVRDTSVLQYNLTHYASNLDYSVVVNDSSGTGLQKSNSYIRFSTSPNKGAMIFVTYTSSSNDLIAFTFGSRNSNNNVGAVSVVEGGGCTASGSYSHAEGYTTQANGNNSHAEGYHTFANEFDSHAEGYDTTASGSASHAEGWNTEASGIYGSHSEGYDTTASGQSSHAEGYNTTAIDGYSHAEGQSTIASGQSSHSEGSGTTASGSASHTEGVGTAASAGAAHAEGSGTTASGTYGSHAEGSGTTASGQTSHAEGHNTTASGKYSHAQNFCTNATRDYQTVIGRYNAVDNDQIFIVGNGTASDSLSNAMTVDFAGNAVIKNGLTAKNQNVLLAVKSITRSGTTFTATRLDGTTFTFTQQDNNSVTGVKGNAETSYRTGNVNLTPANIGAQPAMSTSSATVALVSSVVTSGSITAYRFGNVVTIAIILVKLTNLASGTNSPTIATLPQTYRPPKNTYAFAITGNNDVMGKARFHIETGGAINIRQNSGSTVTDTYTATITYIVS